MQKNVYPVRTHVVKSINPFFFWKYCEKCEKEFRRERGWQFIRIIHGTFDIKMKKHVCSRCCSTAKDVLVYFKATGTKPTEESNGL